MHSNEPETELIITPIIAIDASLPIDIIYSPTNKSLVPINRPIRISINATDSYGNIATCEYWQINKGK